MKYLLPGGIFYEISLARWYLLCSVGIPWNVCLMSHIYTVLSHSSSLDNQHKNVCQMGANVKIPMQIFDSIISNLLNIPPPPPEE